MDISARVVAADDENFFVERRRTVHGELVEGALATLQLRPARRIDNRLLLHVEASPAKHQNSTVFGARLSTNNFTWNLSIIEIIYTVLLGYTTHFGVFRKKNQCGAIGASYNISQILYLQSMFPCVDTPCVDK